MKEAEDYIHASLVFGWLGAIPSFFIFWYIAVQQWGFLIGFCLGWIVAVCGAYAVYIIVMITWPIIFFGGLYLWTASRNGWPPFN